MASPTRSFMLLILYYIVLVYSNCVFAKIFQSFSGIAERTIPGVVNIRTSSYVRKAPGQDLYQFFLDGRLPQTDSTTSLGSGVIISSDGLIVTNYHVIKDADKIEILLAENRNRIVAKVIGSDTKTDLALLQVKTNKRLEPLTLGDSSALKIGDIVLAIGNPFGYSHTVTSGIISAKGRVIGTGPYDNFLQTDASIHPGNSGGPLIDIRGRVIGINTAVETQGHGIGFAIPINMVKVIVADLQKYGKVIRPWLGIVGKNILSIEDIEASVDPSGVYGVIVANMVVDGPAFKAGLKIGDLIMSLDSQKIFDLNMLQRFLLSKKPSDSVSLKIYRRGRGFMNLNMPLEEIPKTKDLPEHDDLL